MSAISVEPSAAHHDRLEGVVLDVARGVGQQIAVESGSSRLTYRELVGQATELAACLAATVPEQFVGLRGTKDPLTYVAYLAILVSGRTVVPLGSDFSDRDRRVCEAARLGTVLSARADQDDPTTIAAARVITPEALVTQARHDTGAPPAPAPYAYVLFTSGSTGRPKGVPIRHSNAIAYLSASTTRHDLDSQSRVSANFDLTFDLSVHDTFLTWASGATLVLPRPREQLTPVSYVNDRGLTHWFSVPSAIRIANRLRALPARSMPSLRTSLFCGERLLLADARLWKRAAPESSIANLYGPTELTIACAGYRLPREMVDWPVTSNGTVPVGEVYPNLEWRISDGELLLRGVQRFDGYLDARDNPGRFLSAAAPPDSSSGGARVTTADNAEPAAPQPTVDRLAWYRTGDRVRLENETLVYLGRDDSQVKVRGHRVELGEVEALLRTDGDVADAAAFIDTGWDADSGDRLVAAVVRSSAGIDVKSIRQRLLARFPPYLVPERIVVMDCFPLTGHGKTDRAAIWNQIATSGRR